MVHLCLTLENMKPHDEFVRNYCETHPLFEKKADMGRMLGNMLDNELLKSKYLINVKQGVVKKVTKDTYGYQRALDGNFQQFIDESLATYTARYAGLKEDLRTAKNKDIKAAKEHADVTDYKSEVYVNIQELKKNQKGKKNAVSAELMELEKTLLDFDRRMNERIDISGKDKNYNQAILEIQSLYNDISMSIDNCLKKSSNYGSLKHGKLMLQKLKKQCLNETKAIRGAALT